MCWTLSGSLEGDTRTMNDGHSMASMKVDEQIVRIIEQAQEQGL